MDVVLAGTGETVDLPIIIFGMALLFGLIFFMLWFPSWRRRRLLEQREQEYIAAYEEAYGSETVEGSPDDAPGAKGQTTAGAATAGARQTPASERYDSNEYEIDTP